MTRCHENESCSKVLNFLERLDDIHTHTHTYTQTHTHTHTHTQTHTHTHKHTHKHTQIQFLIREVASEVNWNGSIVKKITFQVCLKRWKS